MNVSSPKPGNYRSVIVVMGVSGSGKSAVGRSLAQRLGLPYLEGDDLHPASNVAKMAHGVPLDDADRAPWLAAIHAWILARADGGGVVACSALKQGYREMLRDRVTPTPALVLLAPSRATLLERMTEREGHFMPLALLDSQLATLEYPSPEEDVLVLGNEGVECATIATIVDRVSR